MSIRKHILKTCDFGKGLTLELKLTLTVTDPPPGMTVPTEGMLMEVKYPLPSNAVTGLPLPSVADVRLRKTAVGLETDPFVHPKPVIVMGPKPTLLMINVLSLPVSWSAEPTTIPSKSTCSGFMVMNGAELVLIPVRVTGWVVAYPVTPLTVRRSIEVV